MLKAKTRWKVSESDKHKVDELVEQLHITPLVASLLVNRGMTVETAREFLNTEHLQFHDPYLLDGMDDAINRIRHAINNKERILIFGDYDADGVSSTTVLLTALLECGADAEFYIPNRFTEGYGPNEKAYRWAKQEGFSLLITVDTGISAIHEAEVARELGLDVIITDHHEPGPVLPHAYAIIHPKKPTCLYPFKDLAGVGVAFKLAHALLGVVPESLLEIAAIGTIADLVPLHGENRLLASHGIKKLQTTNRVGIKALLDLCGINQAEVNEETIGFAIGPRINAVGRLESADPAVHLLMTTDSVEAKELAQEIDELNKQRQQLVSEMAQEAIQEVENFYPPEENGVLVIAKEGWNPGVIGIVASKLVERYYRPTIVLSIDREKGVAKGSARSIVGFNLYENLSTCREILPHFGGHPMAAGMTLNIEDVDELRARLNKLATEQLTADDFVPVTEVEVVCEMDEVTLEAINEMGKLAPFGMNNPKPKVLIKDLSMANIRRIGSDKNHLKIVFEKDGQSLDSVGFGLGEKYNEISPISKISVVGELSINEWNNFRKPQIMLNDLAVEEWQLFDMRGIKAVKTTIEQLPREKRKLIAFNQETITIHNLNEYREEIMIIDQVEKAIEYTGGEDYVCLLDLPKDGAFVTAIFSRNSPSRVYTFFLNQQSHFFSTIPTRDHFKWFYAFLAKKGRFDLKRHGADLAKHKGWTIETINFMSKVFFELEFVKIDEGFITLSNHAAKRDLSESKTYQEKQRQIELENKFLYSSYQQLKEWFDAINKGSLTFEEAIN